MDPHQQHGLFMKQLLLQDLQVPLLLLQLPADVLLPIKHSCQRPCDRLRKVPNAAAGVGGTCSRSARLFSSSALRRSSSSLRRRSISSMRLFSSCSRRRCSRSCCLLISRSRRCCCGATVFGNYTHTRASLGAVDVAEHRLAPQERARAAVAITPWPILMHDRPVKLNRPSADRAALHR